MKYVSTRGQAPALGFSDVLLAGLARDGGLYLPESWPQVSTRSISGLAGRPYADVAAEVLKPFVGAEVAHAELLRMCREAYASFDHPAVAPLRQLGPSAWVLELFHGPTLAFKDVAMQLLARLMDHVLARRNRGVTIVGATSGDTGAAAVEAFQGRDNIDVFVLFPQGRISSIQQRQMTTAVAGNVHAIAVDGTFDDCQAILKKLFGDADFRERTSLAGINSINWARILGQIVYYFTSAVALGAPHRPVSFTVPTGNFGDIFAGYAAKRMGLPVDRLVIATNSNDILARVLDSGRYELRPVIATASPSMDIQVSSNFERLLFEAHGRRAEEVTNLMDDLALGSFEIEAGPLEVIRGDFSAGTADEDQTAATIRETYERTGFLADPHTAVGLHVANSFARSDVPMITLATAHPAKFPQAVAAAVGLEPSLPKGLANITRQPERFDVMENNQEKVAEFIAARTRAAVERV